MSGFDEYFQVSLQKLSRVKDKRQRLTLSRQLEKYVLQSKNPFQAYLLATQIEHVLDVSRLENLIINSGEGMWIAAFARNIARANIKRLQAAIIKTRNLYYIVKFACFVPKANKKYLEKIILEFQNPWAAYSVLKYIKGANIEKFKAIILKSKRPRYLYQLAKLTKNPHDLSLIEELIIKGKSNLYVRLYAKHIPGANLSKLENRILETRDIEEIKRFALYVKSPRLSKVLSLF